MIADMHVHFRDEEQKYKETIAHGLEVARDSGISVVGDMPNTTRPVIDESRLLERFYLAKNANVPEVAYGAYIGATPDGEQLKRAFELTRKYSFQKNPRFFVAGMKAFMGESVGNLAMKKIEEQEIFYETAASEGFEGIAVLHAEIERWIRRDKNGNQMWNPLDPITHCYARPPVAETESVATHIDLYEKSGAKFKLHFAHISVPRSIELINQARQKGSDVSSESAPHHFMFSHDDMNLLLKMNPPLRPEECRSQLLEILRNDENAIISTDHAPHTLKEKLEFPYMSGIPTLPWWPLFIEFLRRNDFSEEQIKRVTFTNALKRFGIDVPENRNPRREHKKYYEFDPYEKLEEQLKFI